MCELLFGVGHDAGWAATHGRRRRSPAPWGVAVIRNAPKYHKICVNPVSQISAEARGSGELGGSQVPSVPWLLWFGPCSECCPHLRDGGWGASMIYHILLPPRACVLHIYQRQSSLFCLPRVYGSIQHTLVVLFLITIVRYFILLYTILFNITKHTTVFLS